MKIQWSHILIMRKYQCRIANCNTLIDEPGYCNRHKQYERTPYKNASNPNKNLYNSHQWRALRKEVLELDKNVCSKCGSNYKLSVHHIIPPRGDETLFFALDNCITLCMTCHRIITAKEIAGRK